jgi:RNA polymerase sigma factor (sigma-70 family)
VDGSPGSSSRTARDDRALDAAFARFVTERDGDALAVVFDGAAPRLLLVAARLTGDAEAAQDLVQQVFLEAVRGAERFRVGAPVMPWLWTILTRRAQRFRRAANRDTLAEAVDLAARDAGPVAEAITRETVARIEAAVAEIEAPYREVLALRLLHELEPRAIADALDRPLATVHTQLRRGLERLRGLVTPAVFASISAAALATAQVSALVRSRVLAEAGRVLESLGSASGAASTGAGASLVGSGVAASWITGVVAMKKFVWVVVGLGLLALGYSVLSVPQWGVPGGDEAARAGDGRALVADVPTDEDSSRATPARSAAEPTSSDADGSAVPPGRLGLVGRVVSERDGTPIADARVRVSFYDPWVGQRGATEPPEPIEVVSDTTGRFAVEFDYGDPARLGLDIEFSAPGFANAVGGGYEIRDAQCIDVGDVRMLAAFPVMLRIQGEPDLPAGYALRMERLERFEPSGGPISMSASIVGDVDLEAGGAARLELPLGAYELDERLVSGPTLPGSIAPRAFVVDGSGPQVVELRLRRDSSTSAEGIVVDVEGRPIGGAEVLLRRSDEPGLQFGTSLPDGRFAVLGLESGVEYSASIRAPLSMREGLHRLDDALEVVAPERPIVAGARDLRIVVRPVERPEQRFRVVDTAGQPVERFGVTLLRGLTAKQDPELVWAYEDFPFTEAELARRKIGPRVDGVFTASLEPARYLLLVALEPDAAALGRPRLQSMPVDLRPGRAPEKDPVPLRLARSRGLSVRVVDDRKRPVAGVIVEVREVLIDRPWSDREERIEDLRLGPAELGESSHRVRLAIGATDAEGRVALRFPDAPLLKPRLVVRGACVEPIAIDVDPMPPEGTELQVVVPLGAAIEGRLVGGDAIRAWGLEAPESGYQSLLIEGARQLEGAEIEVWAGDERVDGVILRRDQTFSFPAVPAGRPLRLRLIADQMEAQFDVASLAPLVPAETRHVEVDFGPFTPARLTVELPATEGSIGAWLTAVGPTRRRSQARDGVCVFDRLPPGTYAFVLDPRSPDGGPYTERVFGDRVTLERGEDVTTRLAIAPPPELVVEVVDPRGAPVPACLVQVRALGPNDAELSSVRGRTDTDGSMRTARVPGLRVRIEIERETGETSQSVDLGTFDLTPGVPAHVRVEAPGR